MSVFNIKRNVLINRLGLSGAKDTIAAVLKGNKRNEVGRDKYKVFPEHPSESNNPQKVPRNAGK